MGKGATLNYTDKLGYDAAMYSAKAGYNKVLEIILNYKIDYQRQNKEGLCLLMVAIKFKRIRLELLSKLNKLTNNYRMKDKIGRTVLIHCINVDNALLIKQIINTGKCKDIRKDVIRACRRNDGVATVKSFHNQGLDLNAHLDPKGLNIACIAAAFGTQEILEYILEICGKDGLGGDYNLRSPIHHATLNNQMGCLKFLLSKNVDINTQDKLKQTPLMYAAYKGDIDLCKFLMDKSADICMR
eukprot:UN30360